MDRLRIAVALPHLGVYGGIRRFLELGNVWSDRGHEVALLTPRGDERAWLPFRGRIGALGPEALRGWDVLLSPDPERFVAAGAPGALRVFYAVLEGAPGERAALAAADLVLANSSGIARYIQRRGVVAVPAPGGIDPSRFRPADPDPRRERAARGEPVRVLIYGRTSRKRKGTWTAVRAVERAARSARAEVLLTLFDSPPEGIGAPSLPRAPRVPHRWVLHPTQEDLALLYADADLFVSAERRAGWCNTGAEAMASGAALVCTRSGTEDFAHDGVTALVSKRNWSWTLARRIAPLLREPERRMAIAARGRSKIHEFSWERTAETIERALRVRLEGRGDAGESLAS